HSIRLGNIDLSLHHTSPCNVVAGPGRISPGTFCAGELIFAHEMLLPAIRRGTPGVRGTEFCHDGNSGGPGPHRAEFPFKSSCRQRNDPARSLSHIAPIAGSATTTPPKLRISSEPGRDSLRPAILRSRLFGAGPGNKHCRERDYFFH